MNQEQLKEALHYCPESGVFTWKVRRGGPAVVGARAGTLNTSGYRYIRLFNQVYPAHHLAFLYMTGSLPPENLEVDHLDRVRVNNAWSNLRIVNRTDNLMNMNPGSYNKSGAVGVYWQEHTGRWAVQVRYENKKMYFGSYEDLELACLVNAEARCKYAAKSRTPKF